MIGRFLRPLWRPSPYREVSHDIYGVVVAQSRQPAFYLDYGMPDTVTGRFDLLCLHMFLFSNRLAREADGSARQLGQELFDRFSADVDRALRELGIGDTSVPKRKKRLIHGFYGQIEDFGEALDAGDAATLALRAATRFAPREGESHPAAIQSGRLARYMIAARDALRAADFGALEAGRIDWPEPERTH